VKLFSTISFLLTIFCFSSNELIGQLDSLVEIETIEIIDTKIRSASIGSQTQNWNKKGFNKLNINSLPDLLSQEANIFIKSYGSGSLATSSIRGGSAGHTLLLWNGLPLQSPMLGLLDLSFLPLNIAEEINLQRGGNSALWGSGAIGGTISMANQADFSNRLSISSRTEIGSFGLRNQQFQLRIGNSKIQTSSKYFYKEADNDFLYFISPNLPKRQQTNAHFLQKNFLQDIYWKINERHRLQVHYWRQFNDRQIPPTNVQTRNEAYQIDQSNRLIINWKYANRNYFLEAKAGVFDETLDYNDPLYLIESLSKFRTYFNEFNGQIQLKEKYQLLFGTTFTNTSADNAAYENPPTEQRFAFFTNHIFRTQKWTSQLSLRQEFIDGKRIPVVPILAINYEVNSSLQLNGKVSRNYRLPTFNDRFWRPGGNEDLLAENGWSEEMGLKSRFKKDAWILETNTSIFNRNIDNWILWSIQEGQQFWSANNIAKVWSRGVEQRLSLENERWFKLTLGYDYIRSTNQIALTLPKIAGGSQLFYTPEHQGFVKADFQWKNITISYQHQFVGASLGINDNLAAYQIGNARFQYQIQRGKYQGQLFLNIHNIWNTDYFIIERRPMPGRYYSLGARILFIKN